ncbi:hypothetical protein B566_EDAN009963 [Ephemera danica]|nr:hypothetical protein B566_EDAN009963 [Ephemera danica]
MSSHLLQSDFTGPAMKFLLTCLALVAVVQAVDWANVKPKVQYVTPVGHSKSKGEGRIIGGSQSEVHQFPYQVGLFMDGLYFCGGSVLSDTIIMTAAHCAEGTGQFEVHLGAQNIYQNNEPDHQVVFTRDYTVHAMWNAQTINNDIAFIRLEAPVSGPGIGIIRLPSRSQQQDTFAGSIATVSGWGAVSDTDTGLSSQLKFANVTVISNSECYIIYGSTINDNKICTDTAGGTQGTCFGDSGGPLAIYEADGLPTQIGIVSFVASAGCESGFPDGLTRGDSGGPLAIYEADGLPTQIGIVSFVASAGCESGFPDGLTRVTYYLDWLEFNAGIPIRP